MKEMEIGKSGLRTPAVAMGTWAIGGGSWWGDNDDRISIETIRRALDCGIRWIDTAPVYGFGHSEEVVGRALDGRRETALLSTKCGMQWRNTTGYYHKSNDGRDIYRDLRPASIRRDLEDSLRRLHTDHIDILYTHWQSAGPDAAPIADTMGELMRMKTEGKICAVGASNVAVEHLKKYQAAGQLDVIQEKFSILDRRLEAELLPYCREHQITVQAYSPLEQGLLTGKATMQTLLASGDVRNNNPWWQPETRQKVLDMLDGWCDLTERYRCTLGNLVIAWTAFQGVNVLCGARRVEQIEDNARAADISLAPEDAARMTRDADRLIAEI